RLLNRTTRKVELTDVGKIYFESCKRIVDEARSAHEQLAMLHTTPTGVLRASLPADFSSVFLAPIISKFSEIYPDLKFEFDITPRQADLIAENFDLAIRMGYLPDSNLIAHKLLTLNGQLYASPKYLEKFGCPTHPDDLKNHECLNFPKNEYWILQKGTESHRIKTNSKFVMNNMAMMKRLALLNQGIIFTHPQVVFEELKNHTLTPIIPDWIGESLPVFILTESRLLPAKTKLFIDFLKENI
ncbi:LysR family transcriptional regulator, partial [Acinetobacter guillouiae]|uniref:LysR family transcriptional regulator n=1 Tax=Acinetobacter guillouiae TaxID=106649 RepID=UPI0030097933